MSSWLSSLQVYTDRRMLLLLALGFSSGLPMLLVFSTLTVWLTEVGVDKSTVGVFALVSMPYSFKFVWAPLVDRARLPGLTRLLGRRRAWLLVSQVALAAALVAMGLSSPATAAGTTAALAVCVAFASATQDIVIDAYRVELLEPDEQAAGAAVAVFGYRMAMLASGAGALLAAGFFGTSGPPGGAMGALWTQALVAHWDALSPIARLQPQGWVGPLASVAWTQTYLVMAALVGVGLAATLLGGEPVREATDPARRSVVAVVQDAVIAPFSEFMRRYGLATFVILSLVVLFKLADALAAVMRNPFLLEAGFTKEQIAAIAQTYGMVASIVGSLWGGVLVKKLGLKRSLWWASVLMMGSNLMFAWQAMAGDSVGVLTAVITVENLTGGFGTTTLVAWLSAMCNVRYTATQYALLTSLSSIARTTFSASSGMMAQALGWAPFFVATAVAGVPALVLLWWLGRRGLLTPARRAPDAGPTAA